jgi:hypothetical protein
MCEPEQSLRIRLALADDSLERFPRRERISAA